MSSKDNIENIILVDASYTTFYRFFATMRWFSFANKEEYKKYKGDNNYDWSENEIFIEKYKKMYLESIIKLVRKRCYNKSKLIFCLDSPRETIWRNKLMDNYKGGRTDLSLKHNFKPTFKLTYEKLIPQLIKDNPDKITSMKIQNIEADDIIALSVKYIKTKHDDLTIYLVSGDEDFLQLGFNKLFFVNYKKKKVFQLTEKEAKMKLKLKILCGDSSDNISSIFPKDRKLLSNKKRKLIKEVDGELKKYLEENPENKKKYNLNKKLIDFTHIPKKYHQKVFKSIKKFLPK